MPLLGGREMRPLWQFELLDVDLLDAWLLV